MGVVVAGINNLSIETAEIFMAFQDMETETEG